MIREPRIVPTPLDQLRPTQITVGLREVQEKRVHWRTKRGKSKFLGNHLIPVIHGFKDRLYVIDHHHLARALHDEGVEEVAIAVIADLRRLDRESFWNFMDARGWMHPYDEQGRRRSYRELPRTVADLKDDPYRSLAGELRHAGGFSKDTTPFSEFLWADFLRRRIERRQVERRFNAALRTALRLARSLEADYLPGWCGPVRR